MLCPHYVETEIGPRLRFRGRVESLEEVINELADALDYGIDIAICNVECRCNDNVVSARPINCTRAWVHVDIVAVFQTYYAN